MGRSGRPRALGAVYNEVAANGFGERFQKQFHELTPELIEALRKYSRGLDYMIRLQAQLNEKIGDIPKVRFKTSKILQILAPRKAGEALRTK